MAVGANRPLELASLVVARLVKQAQEPSKQETADNWLRDVKSEHLKEILNSTNTGAIGGSVLGGLAGTAYGLLEPQKDEKGKPQYLSSALRNGMIGLGAGGLLGAGAGAAGTYAFPSRHLANAYAILGDPELTF